MPRVPPVTRATRPLSSDWPSAYACSLTMVATVNHASPGRHGRGHTRLARACARLAHRPVRVDTGSPEQDVLIAIHECARGLRAELWVAIAQRETQPVAVGQRPHRGAERHPAGRRE